MKTLLSPTEIIRSTETIRSIGFARVAFGFRAIFIRPFIFMSKAFSYPKEW